MTESHDWWSRLSPFEKSSVRAEEREIDRKTDLLEVVKKKRGYERTKQKLELEIAGHRFFRQQLVNRGIQRAILNISPKKRKQDRKAA